MLCQLNLTVPSYPFQTVSSGLLKVVEKKSDRFSKKGVKYRLFGVRDAGGTYRYLTLWNERINLQVEKVYAFTNVRVGQNITSLFIDHKSKASMVTDDREEKFESFHLWTEVKNGEIEGVQDVVEYDGCDSCGAKIYDSEQCTTCKMPKPKASHQCR